MRFVRGAVAGLIAVTLSLPSPLWGAELTPIPPVALPRAGTPPETQPPVALPPAALPPAVSLPSSPAEASPSAAFPSAVPPSPAVPSPAVPSPTASGTSAGTFPPSPGFSPPSPPTGGELVSIPPLTSLPAETVPETSQPLRPVSPETIAETQKKIEEEGIYFNVADEDIREVIKQISRALGKNFILDDKVKGKITIISERKMTKDEVWEAFQSALDVIGLTIVEGPAGLLRLVPTREAVSNPIELLTEGVPYSDRFVTRLITPKNISASDTANVIKNLVSKEGNLIAYPATNTLILTDSGTNIDRLIRLINQLDQEGPQEVLEIIQLTYADAKDMASKLNQIFEVQSKPQGGGGTAPKRGAKAGEGGEETETIQKIIPDDRTNSLIILASKTAIQKVRDLIRQLDSPLPGPAEGEVHVYYLKHANAKDMATVLTALAGAVAQSKGKGGASQPTTAKVPEEAASVISGVSLSGKWSVTADESTNALVITSSPKDFQVLIDQVISKLDIPRRQVYVEAVIVELSVAEDQQLGVGAIGGKTFNAGGHQIAAFGSTFGFLDVNRLLGGSLGGADTNTTININQPGATGSTTQLSVPAFFTALQLAQGNTDVNILSTPNLLTLDNQEAEIKVGQKVPFPTAAATTIGGSLQTTFTREDVALSLKIKPQISESDTIRLEVTQEDREVLPQQEQPSIAAQAGPSTTERSIKTAIVANNGQTIVLGGLIKDKYTTVVNKVPLLGDIPILGYLFKTRHKSKSKVNLVVFLTPHIIREPRDFLAIVEKKINEKNAFIAENFNRSQQKQIKKSIETHANYLMEYSGSLGGSANPPPPAEEPVETPIPPPPPARSKKSKPRSSSRPSKSTAPAAELPAPVESPPSGGEEQDLSGTAPSGEATPSGSSNGNANGDDLSIGEPPRVHKKVIEQEKKRSKAVNPPAPE